MSGLAQRPVRTSMAGRMGDFVLLLFPPATYVPSALANFAAVYLGAQALFSRAPLELTWRSLGGALSTVLFMLLMRVYDELKDVETDKRLGAAGDPKYQDRPIVTGHVREEDIRALRWVVTFTLVALHLVLGFPWPALAFLGLFFLLWLSFKWFFWPAVSRHLLLAFVTHNPLALFFGAYIASYAVADFGPELASPRLLPLLAGTWLPLAVWETGRKVRAPEEETDYQTYSKVLGVKAAAALPALFTIASTSCLGWVALKSGLGWPYPAALGAASLVVLGGCARFAFSPSPRSAKLRPLVELYVLVAMVGLVLALALTHAVRWAASSQAGALARQASSASAELRLGQPSACSCQLV